MKKKHATLFKRLREPQTLVTVFVYRRNKGVAFFVTGVLRRLEGGLLHISQYIWSLIEKKVKTLYTKAHTTNENLTAHGFSTSLVYKKGLSFRFSHFYLRKFLHSNILYLKYFNEWAREHP